VQKRRAVRFRASVPIELLDVPANGRLAVSLDLSEGGSTLLWPGDLAVGARLRLRVHLGPSAVECDGRVMSVHPRQRGGWVGYGMQFDHLSTESTDRLADAIYNMAVPEIFARLSLPSMPVRLAKRLAGRLKGSLRARADRHDACLPIRVQSRGGEFLATTRDLSEGGLNLISPRPLVVGSIVRLILHSPEGEWSSPATVVRTRPIESAVPDLRTWQVGLRVDGHTNAVGLRHVLIPEAVS